MKDLIIGYYGQAFWGGGTYIKLTKRQNEDYKMEYVRSVMFPNYVPNAEKYIRSFERISFQSENGFDQPYTKDEDFSLTCRYLKENDEIRQIIQSLHDIDLSEMSKTEYYIDIFDSLNWSFFVQFDDQQYYIKGYVERPDELTEIICAMTRILFPDNNE